jgi:hypothetical protein
VAAFDRIDRRQIGDVFVHYIENASDAQGYDPESDTHRVTMDSSFYYNV